VLGLTCPARIDVSNVGAVVTSFLVVVTIAVFMRSPC